MATAKPMRDQSAEDLGHQVDDAVADMVDRSSRATSEMLETEGSLASLWLELTHAQVTHHLEAMQQLMECRDWRSAAQIQQAFVQASVARFGETMCRHVELTGRMASRLVARDQAAIA